MAYGINAPFGLRPIATVHGGDWSQNIKEYAIYSNPAGTQTYGTSLYRGDPVMWGTSLAGTPTVNGGVGTIAQYNPGFTDGTPSTFSTAPMLGVFMGCSYQSPNQSITNAFSSYWPGGAQVVAGSPIIAYVLTDPSIIFDIQVSTSKDAVGNAFTGNPVFPNTNQTAGAPFSYYGSLGRNFALNIGGGTNFNTVNPNYANNPATGSPIMGSAFYLDVDTSNAADYAGGHDYIKDSSAATSPYLPLRAYGYSTNIQNLQAVQNGSPFVNVLVTINNHVSAVGSKATVYVA